MPFNKQNSTKNQNRMENIPKKSPWFNTSNESEHIRYTVLIKCTRKDEWKVCAYCLGNSLEQYYLQPHSSDRQKDICNHVNEMSVLIWLCLFFAFVGWLSKGQRIKTPEMRLICDFLNQGCVTPALLCPLIAGVNWAYHCYNNKTHCDYFLGNFRTSTGVLRSTLN